jgi:hypothetical protein
MTIHGPARLGLLVSMVALSAIPTRAETVNKHVAPKHPPAQAQAQRIGGAGPWSAYLYKAASGSVCYLAGAPRKSEPARFRRKPPSATVTHRPKENVFDVVNFYEGYPLKPGSDASLDIDGTDFDLFTKDDGAWSRTADTDKTIVRAMAKGRTAVIKATPEKGPTTTDTYSLSGFTATLAMIDKACGVKP